jgi:hypothetical protein
VSSSIEHHDVHSLKVREGKPTGVAIPDLARLGKDLVEDGNPLFLFPMQATDLLKDLVLVVFGQVHRDQLPDKQLQGRDGRG